MKSQVLIKNMTKFHLDYIKGCLILNPYFKSNLNNIGQAVIKSDTILLKDTKGRYLNTLSSKVTFQAYDDIMDSV